MSATRHARAGPGRLRLHAPAAPTPGGEQVRRWLIDGFPATITIWSAEEWAALADRPRDALAYPDGTRAALRIE